MKGLCDPLNQRARDFLTAKHSEKIYMINSKDKSKFTKTYSFSLTPFFYNIFEVRTHARYYTQFCTKVKGYGGIGMQHCTSGETGNIHERLKYLRKTLGLSQEEFGKRIGKSLRTIQYWEASTVQIPDTALKLISQVFGVSYEWLKEGKGEMWERKVLVKELKEKTEETLESFTQIPLVRRSWVGYMEVAGWGLVSKETILKGGQLAVQVKGDSMEPSLRNGDLVVFKLYMGDGSDIPSGKIVIVRDRNGELLVRRLVRIDAVMMLVSDNPKYPPIPPEQFKTEDLRIVGVAVKIVREIEV